MDAYFSYVYSLCTEAFPAASDTEISDLTALLLLRNNRGQETDFLEQYQNSTLALAEQFEAEFLTTIEDLKQCTYKTVMFLWNHDTVEPPLAAMYQEVITESDYQWIYAVTSDELSSSESLNFSIKQGALFIPRNCEVHLGFLFAVISTDGFLPSKLPKQVYRMALVHGLILSDTWPAIDHYFQYLAGQFNCLFYSAKLTQKNNTQHYVGQYPRELIEHDSHYFDVVAGGYAKLDALYRLSANCEVSNKVIFHLSSIHYAKYDTSDLQWLVEHILNRYPKYAISIRPFPGQLSHYQYLQGVFKRTDRISWDLTEVYNDNYKDAKLLISSNSHSIRTFALGTGRPAMNIIFNKEQPESLVEEYGYSVVNKDDFVRLVNNILEGEQHASTGVDEMVGKWANPGASKKRFIQHLKCIEQGDSDAEYRYQLFDTDTPNVKSVDNIWQYVNSQKRLPARAEVARLGAIKFSDFNLAKRALALRIEYLGTSQLASTVHFPLEQISQFLLCYLQYLPTDTKELNECLVNVIPLIRNALISDQANVDLYTSLRLIREKFPTISI